MIRLTTYNILSTEYAEPSFYHKCNPVHLETSYRWGKLMEKLINEIKYEAIICLQEVSLNWSSLLYPFFNENNYYVIFDPYGKMKSNFMGLMIAIPTKYKLKQTKFICIGNELGKITTSLTTSISLTDYWNIAINRDNRLMFIKLEINKKIFCVANYHMPCVQDTDVVIGAHAALIIQYCEQLSDGSPFIITGDFNIKPDNQIYKKMCYTYDDNDNNDNKKQQQISFSDIIGDQPNYFINWIPIISKKLKSAYYEKYGTEPLYTHYSFTKTTEPFCATLDYIFYSDIPNFKLDNVVELPKTIPESLSFPDKNEPSDHLPVSCTFKYVSD